MDVINVNRIYKCEALATELLTIRRRIAELKELFQTSPLEERPAILAQLETARKEETQAEYAYDGEHCTEISPV